jgi:hypothetical protein
VSEATICRGSRSAFPTAEKRSTGATERDERLRLVWRSVVGGLDSRRLVFVDEMGTHNSLAPLYGYSPRGQRAFFKIPRNRGTNTTLLASISLEGMRWCSITVVSVFTPREALRTECKESRRGWLRISVAMVQSEVNAVPTPTPHRDGRTRHDGRAPGRHLLSAGRGPSGQ